jgi:hypothetical protein
MTAPGRTSGGRRTPVVAAAALALVGSAPPAAMPLPHRRALPFPWRPDDRALISDCSYIPAVAASPLLEGRDRDTPTARLTVVQREPIWSGGKDR